MAFGYLYECVALILVGQLGRDLGRRLSRVVVVVDICNSLIRRSYDGKVEQSLWYLEENEEIMVVVYSGSS